MPEIASLSLSLSRRRTYVLDDGGYPDITLPQEHSPNVQRLWASVANDCNRGRAPFCTFLTTHFDFEANSKVCMMGAPWASKHMRTICRVTGFARMRLRRKPSLTCPMTTLRLVLGPKVHELVVDERYLANEGLDTVAIFLNIVLMTFS